MNREQYRQLERERMLQLLDEKRAREKAGPVRGEAVNQEEYEKDLRRRQQEHFERVMPQARPFRPCLHDGCQSCVGTGIRIDGSSCIHMLSCSCPKCSWR